MALIYILDSNVEDRQTLTTYLELAEHQVKVLSHSKDLFLFINSNLPKLVIIEAASPNYDGFLVAKKLSDLCVPFMFVTERGEESDRIIGFELGAEEYVVKPYSTKETVLRVEKVLRLINKSKRKNKNLQFEYKDSTLIIENVTHKSFLDDTPIFFTSTEWKVLQYLISNDNVSVSREKLLEECLDFHFNGYKRAIDTHIKKIRAKLLDSGWIETDRGYGYRFVGTKVK